LKLTERPALFAERQVAGHNTSAADGARGGRMRISLDWWAVIAAAAAVVLIKSGLIAGIPW